MLASKIRDDLNTARKERDKLRTTVLTTMLSEIRNKEIELKHELTDDDVVEVVNRQLKRRREAAEQMRSGGREELAVKEEQEADMLKAYLPQQVSEADARTIVREAIAGGAKDVGSVMKAVMPKLKGRFDGKETNRLVREELG
jgi:uncharacterized protein YqeY